MRKQVWLPLHDEASTAGRSRSAAGFPTAIIAASSCAVAARPTQSPGSGSIAQVGGDAEGDVVAAVGDADGVGVVPAPPFAVEPPHPARSTASAAATRLPNGFIPTKHNAAEHQNDSTSQGALAEFPGAGEAVADAGHRKNEERMGRILLDLSPQVADVDIDHARLDRVLVAPHMVEDLLARQDLARV